MTGPVIAIAGAPGSGKTTLAAALAGRIGATRVAFDDHETMTRQPPGRIRDWIARGAPLAEVTAPGFAEAIAAARARGGPVVVEAPLGPVWPGTAQVFDCCIWIDCPADVALARKAGALLDRPGPAEGRLAALSGFLAAYPAFSRAALQSQAAAVPPSCDIVLNGLDEIGAIVDAAETALLPWL